MAAIDRFNLNIERAKEQAAKKNDEAVRFGCVLAVAAMDDYFTQKFVDMLVNFIKQKGLSKDLEAIFDEAKFTLNDAFELIKQMQAKKGSWPWRKVRTRIDAHISRRTTQKFDIINELFAAYGHPKLIENASKMMGKHKILAGTGLKKPYKYRVAELVKRRHEIVHFGDLNDNNKLPELPKQQHKNRKWFQNRIMAVEKLVECCEEILN